MGHTLTHSDQEAGHKITLNLNDTTDITFVWCPAGEFIMGEHPARSTKHKVILTKGFWISDTLITKGQHATILETTPPELGVMSPFNIRTWDNAIDFLKQFTDFGRQRKMISGDWRFHLPTEAQWEYACRAGTTTPWFFGDDETDVDKYAWRYKNPDVDWDYKIVKQKLPNPWGIYDFLGNGYEWCIDSHSFFQKETLTDPIYIREGDFKIGKGGGWMARLPDQFKSADRAMLTRSNPYNDLTTIRVVCSELQLEL